VSFGPLLPRQLATARSPHGRKYRVSEYHRDRERERERKRERGNTIPFVRSGVACSLKRRGFAGCAISASNAHAQETRVVAREESARNLNGRPVNSFPVDGRKNRRRRALSSSRDRPRSLSRFRAKSPRAYGQGRARCAMSSRIFDRNRHGERPSLHPRGFTFPSSFLLSPQGGFFFFSSSPKGT